MSKKHDSVAVSYHQRNPENKEKLCNIENENENEHVFLDDPKSRDTLDALLEDIPTFTFTSKFTEKSLLSSECDEL